MLFYKKNNGMKRICIVTWYYSRNYGTVLQAYALMKIIQHLGYDVCILDEFSFSFDRKNIIKNILGRLGLWPYVKKNLHKKERLLLSFFLEEMKIQYVYSKSSLKRILQKTDVFISGSDQIWNSYYENFSLFYFLPFVKGKKIAYATSVGANSFDISYKEEIKTLLKGYKHIGVREDSAIKLINELTERNDVCQVLDPTFLLSEDDWKRTAETAIFDISLPRKYLLCYLVGSNDNYISQLIDVRRKLGINEIIIIPSAENPNFCVEGATILSGLGPREFVKLIHDAYYICTDSFHATALSLNMSKNFVEFQRFKNDSKESQNSRIYSLFSHYGLMNKMYSQDNDDWLAMYDNIKVQRLLNEDRQKSIEFLINSIEY